MNTINGLLPVRVQFSSYNKLVAEFITHSEWADVFVARYINNRYKKGRSGVGVLIQRADLPRYWNVTIGQEIK